MQDPAFRNTTKFTRKSQQIGTNYVKITWASRLLGISPHTLRRLEEKGDILPVRLPNGHRLYNIDDVKKLQEKIQDEQYMKEERYEERKEKAKSKHKHHRDKIKYFELNERLETTIKGVKNLNNLLLGILFVFSISLFTATLSTDLPYSLKNILGTKDKPKTSSVRSSDVLAAKGRITDFIYTVNIPSIFRSEVTTEETLTAEGLVNILGGLTTNTLTFTSPGTMNNLLGIDDTTETTLEEALDIDGEVVGIGLGDVVIADGVIDETKLADEIAYDGDFDFSGTWSIGGTQVNATGTEINILNGATVTTAELNYLDGTTVIAGGVMFGDGTKITQNSTSFFWNNTLNRLGIGTSSPTAFLDLLGATSTSASLRVRSGSAPTSPNTGDFYSDGTNIYYYNGSSWDDLTDAGLWTLNGTEIYYDGNVGIGTSNPTYNLDVNGTTNITSLYLGGVQVTSDASELNYLDGTSVESGGVTYGDGSKFANTGTAPNGYFLLSTGSNAPTWTDPTTLIVGQADTLDGIDSLQFLRSDTTDTFDVSGGGTLYIASGNYLDVLGSFYLNGSGVTTTANEINVLDGIASSTVELNYLDGISISSIGVVYTDGSKFANTGEGTSGYILQANGSSPPSWVNASIIGGGSATSLDGLTSTQFLRSDTTDQYTSGTLTINSGAIFDVNGDLLIADNDIAYDNTSYTNFNFTNDFSINGNNFFLDKQTAFVGLGNTAPSEKLMVNGRVYLTQTTAPSPTTDRLYNVGGSLFWDGTQLDTGGVTLYSTSGTVPVGEYIELTHNQSTYDVLATGWSYNETTSQWEQFDGTGEVSQIIDLMEYSSDASAQAAYNTNSVSNATGGTITYSGGYTIHTFRSNGTFTPNNGGEVEFLMVGGGGGGGKGEPSHSGDGAGGGGAGGVIYNNSYNVTAQAYGVTVGGGGAGSTVLSAKGGNGGNSVFSSFTAVGGGGGGSDNHDATGINQGANGGSGGGAASKHDQIVYAGAGTANQGNNGGNSPLGNRGGGGGGGGGAVGSQAPSATGGAGGVGLAYSISGSSAYYAGGGGGGASGIAGGGAGGLGGGGAGGNGGAGAAATAYTGGGGGGGAGQQDICNGGAGGIGIVIIRYPTTVPLQAYSESTIKEEGSYAIKGVAQATTGLNKTLTRTVSPTINLASQTKITFNMRASRTGSNIKIGIHDTGGTTTEVTPNITSVDIYQTIEWDISSVADVNKDAIDQIIITVVNADALNTFYIDDMNAVNSYKIVQPDNNNVRLYNYSDSTQNLRLDVIASGADLAEWYTVSDDSLETGDIVSVTGNLDEYESPIITKSYGSFDNKVIGIVSSNANIKMGIERDNRKLVALSGRVPVKISPNSPTILAGNYITSSDIPGFGKKATGTGRVVGVALENWYGDKETILVLVDPTWFSVANDSIANNTSNNVLEEILEVRNEILDNVSEFIDFSTIFNLSKEEKALVSSVDMNILGDLTLNNLNVGGNIQAGMIEVDTLENSINVLGASCYNHELDTLNARLCQQQTLFLQKDLTGNVNLFDGKVVFEPDGSMTVNKLVLEKDKTAGSSLISSGSTTVFVSTDSITINSKVMITPTKLIETLMAVTNKVPNVGFEVSMTKATTEDITFDWIVIDSIDKIDP